MTDSGAEKQIMVVDDEDWVSDSFKALFEDKGYHVEVANDGEIALEKAAKRMPDIVFLDLNMPRINGVETLRGLRKMSADVPVYIVTAFQKDFIKPLQQAIDDGIEFEMCNKPMDIVKIQEIVCDVLECGNRNPVFRLYVTGEKPSSTRAFETVKQMLDEHLKDGYELKVIDVLKDPQIAEEDKIFATPVLLTPESSRNRVIIGDMTNVEVLKSALNL